MAIRTYLSRRCADLRDSGMKWNPAYFFREAFGQGVIYHGQCSFLAVPYPSYSLVVRPLFAPFQCCSREGGQCCFRGGLVLLQSGGGQCCSRGGAVQFQGGGSSAAPEGGLVQFQGGAVLLQRESSAAPEGGRSSSGMEVPVQLQREASAAPEGREHLGHPMDSTGADPAVSIAQGLCFDTGN